MQTKLLAAATAALLATLLAPGAAAHPADVSFLIPAIPGTPPFFVVPPTEPPSHFLPPVTVAGVTGDELLPGIFLGAGACNVVGEACFAWPAWNPNAPGVPFGWTCEITSVINSSLGQWLLPKVYLVQDDNNNDVLGDPGDVVYAIDFTNPVGWIPFQPFVFPPFPFAPAPPGTGGFTGDAFAPAPGLGLFSPGATVHVVADDLVQGLNPFIDLTVTCAVL